ncbi:MAG TPA: cytosine permease [Acidimicrobiales bacterium]|nr:cytosine permease [Acidimicrobiales bacterium]
MTITAPPPHVMDEAGHVEVKGIDFIDPDERHGRPRELFTLWFTSNLSYLYILFGGLLILFGLTLVQAIAVVLIGNLLYFLVGAIATTGPTFGTSTVNISQLMYGSAGNRFFGAGLTWVLIVCFEAINLSIGALAGFALLADAGIHVTTFLKVIVLLIVAIGTFTLSILGHATIVRATSIFAAVMGVAAVVLFGFILDHAKFGYHPSSPLHGGASLATVFLGLTLIASGPLTWVNVPAEYARYLPQDASRWAVLGWTALGGYLSSAFLGIAGVLAGTVVNMADPQTSMKAIMSGWFYPIFLVLIVVGTSFNNAMGIYTSGLALQAIGVKARRSRTVLLDCIVGGGLTFYAIFVSNFLTTLNNFLVLSEVWLAPYAGVFMAYIVMHWNKDKSTPSRDQFIRLSAVGKVVGPGVVAILAGGVAAFLCADTTYWHGPISVALDGADLSPYVGFTLAAGVYVAMERLMARTKAPASVPAMMPDPA